MIVVDVVWNDHHATKHDHHGITTNHQTTDLRLYRDRVVADRHPNTNTTLHNDGACDHAIAAETMGAACARAIARRAKTNHHESRHDHNKRKSNNINNNHNVVISTIA